MINKHGISGYRNGCRCDVCKSANTVRVANRRARRKAESEASYTTISRPAVVQIAKSAVTLSPESKSVTAQDIARQDMTDILSALENDPDWRGVVEEAISGEIDALCTLIDSHNRSGRLPLLEYGVSQGVFWAGAADDHQEYEQEQSPVTRTMASPVVQLPQRVPLARPRTVQAARTPTVPGEPARTASTTSRPNAVPGEPVWG